MKRAIAMVACIVVPCAGVVALVTARHLRHGGHGAWNGNAIRATLERVVPAHNDASFLYVLENRTATDYRIDESDVEILGRSLSTGDLMPSAAKHVSGDFPLVVPAGRKVHFALVWTADRDIDPARLEDFISNVNIRSFVLLDRIRRYQIELPARR
jgi:hypothetical protein